jgi:hypothetical protein
MRLQRTQSCRAGLKVRALQTQHFGYVGTVDVAVENPHSVSILRKSRGKIGGDGGFPDSSFAAHDNQPMFYVRKSLCEALIHVPLLIL